MWIKQHFFIFRNLQGRAEHGLQEIIWVEITGNKVRTPHKPQNRAFWNFLIARTFDTSTNHKILENSSIFEV